MPQLSPELHFLTLSAALTGLLWVPIIVNRLREMGVWAALRNPQPDVRPHADWAYRLANAHRNAIENLAVFAPLALTVHGLGLGDAGTALAAGAFFWSRLAHALIYTTGVPLLRTLAFVVGFGAQAMLVLRILGLG
ncbi:MAPEG family protein [Roseateles sp. LYH14W]|uniref:MAPEG family protein n=1 Tax=Pelomonas parva TaxID=3299032 RepID=A0ABW7FCI6_9BURK